jgi:UDP-N-acetylglucosamine 1-carboxyvinyltransferase
MGADIRGAGSPVIEIHGVERLGGTGETAHSVLPDRIETGTYLVAGAITGGDVTVTNVRPEHLTSALTALTAAGVRVTSGSDWIRVQPDGDLHSLDLVTAPYPGFATDLQAQYMALMTRAQGTSHLVETIFENRFLHAGELVRLGADIRIDGNTAIVQGPARLEGAPVTASDLRASAALVLAGLVAEGETLVRRIYHLDRGYRAMDARLSELGADVSRIPG